MDNHFSVLLVLALFIAFCAMIRWQQGSWFTPSSFFMLFWTVLASISIIMAPDFYFSPLGLLFILSLLLAFYVGSILVKPKWVKQMVSKSIDPENQKAGFINRVFLYYLIPSTLAGFLAVLLLLKFYEFPFDRLSSESISGISNIMTNDRYEGVLLPRSVMICLAIAYSGSLAGGFVFVYTKSILKKVLTLAPFLPVLIFTLIYTARAPLLYQVILFLSSMMTSGVALKGAGRKLFTKKFIFFGGISLAIILLVFLITQMTRMEAGFSEGQINSTYGHLRTWFFGNLSGFSMWFDQGISTETPVWGSYSLGGLFEMLGLSTRKVGLYDTYMTISLNDDQTNIYTIFRLLIDDFGILRVHIIFVALGFLGSWFYYAVLDKQWQYLPLLSAIYAFQLWSFIASFFTYNTNILAFLIFGLLILPLLLINPNTLK